MMDGMSEYFLLHKDIFAWLAVFSALTFVGSLILIPILCVRMGEDYFRGQFWLECIEVGTIKCAEGSTLSAHEVLLLRAGLKFFIGSYAYIVQPVTLGESA